jgi:hypothetical protein
MKLQAKESDGKHVRLVYDQAKTPLQRLLHVQVLLASKEQELWYMAQVLDPVRLLQQVERLQQALFEGTMHARCASCGINTHQLFLFRN